MIQRVVRAASLATVLLGSGFLLADAQTDLQPAGCCVGDCIDHCRRAYPNDPLGCEKLCARDCVVCGDQDA